MERMNASWSEELKVLQPTSKPEWGGPVDPTTVFLDRGQWTLATGTPAVARDPRDVLIDGTVARRSVREEFEFVFTPEDEVALDRWLKRAHPTAPRRPQWLKREVMNELRDLRQKILESMARGETIGEDDYDHG